MGAPMGNKNAAGSRGGAKRGKGASKKIKKYLNQKSAHKRWVTKTMSRPVKKSTYKPYKPK